MRLSSKSPIPPPEEYDYRIVFVSSLANESVIQICRGGGRQFSFVIGGWRNTTSGFEMINGRQAAANPTMARANHWLVSGRRHVSVVKVRKDGVEGWLDGVRIASYKTDWTDISLKGDCTLRRRDSIGLCVWTGACIESATIIEITGEGRKLGPPPAPDERSMRGRDLIDGKQTSGSASPSGGVMSFRSFIGRDGRWVRGIPAPAIAPFDVSKAKEHQELWAKHLGARSS